MASQTRAKFGYLNYETMLSNLSQETDLKKKLDAYDLNFTPDTKECYIIAPDLTPWAIKSKVYTFDSIESAIEQLNQNTDTYGGQIVAIQIDEKYRGYIVNPLSGGWSISPLSEIIEEIDYNTLGNRPITNLYGEIGCPIIISDLNDGVYIINGQYQISSNLETIFSSNSNNIFIVEKDEYGLYIKKISAKNIIEYSIVDGVLSESNILTTDYLEVNGYATTDYVDTVIDEKINEKLVSVDDTEIEKLFE